jgi:L-arabinose isomerase
VVSSEMMQDFAEMADIECLVIDDATEIQEFKKEIRFNHMYYSLARGI